MVVPDPAGPGGERVKLLDFGIAKLGAAHVQGEDVKTRTGQIMGTAAYMSPEQFGGHKPTDGQSDVYSLGCLMFRMLSGQQPFVSDSGEMAVAAMHMFKPAPPLQTLVPEAMPWLVNLIDSMLRKEPDQRPTMAEVAAILQDELPDYAQSRKSLPPFRMEVSGATHMSNIQGAPRVSPVKLPPEIIAPTVDQPMPLASSSYPGSITGATGEAAQLPARPRRRAYGVLLIGLALVLGATGGTMLLLRGRGTPPHAAQQPAGPALPPAPPPAATPPAATPPAATPSAAPTTPPAPTPPASTPAPTADQPPAVAPTTPPTTPDADPAETDPDAKARRDRGAGKNGKPGKPGTRSDGKSRSRTPHATQIIN